MDSKIVHVVGTGTIGEPLIGLCGIGWTLAVLALVLFKIRQPERFSGKGPLSVIGE